MQAGIRSLNCDNKENFYSMQNLLNELLNALKSDERLLIDGKLAKNKVVELALSMDESLITLLLKNKSIKQQFFKEIGEILVFDKVAFQRFVSNKQFLPDSYTAFRNKIGLTANNEYLTESKEVVLAWPYKDCVLEGGQTKEDQKRDEIFWNETLAPDEIDRLLEPKVLTNFKRYDARGEHQVKNISADDNLIIKGNNLLALHCLKRQYAGNVKLIYIDPPYNTGSDGFKYNDNFNHSTWLTFMRNRLEIAKELLSDDGLIFVQCDDNEQAYLKVLMDNIFGHSNNRSVIYLETVYPEKTLKQDRVFHDQIEQILLYAKSEQSLINQKSEEYSHDKFCWSVSEIGKPVKTLKLGNKRVDIFEKDGFIIEKTPPSANGLKEIWASGTILDMNSSGRFFRDNIMNRTDEFGYNILYKVYDIGDDNNEFRYFTGPKKVGATKGKYYQGVPSNKQKIGSENTKKVSIENFWAMAADFGNCRSEGGVEFKSGKKPEKLLHRIIDLATKENDTVLDFHLGSGTTCAVAHKMNRHYIGIEQLDYGNNDSVIRLKNVIKGDKTGISKDAGWTEGGAFVYCELSQNNASIINKIEKSKTTKSLNTIWQEIESSDFISHKVNPKSINESINEFDALSLDEQKRFLISILDKNQLYVNYSEIDDKDYKLSKEDKKLNKQFYGEA
jgi:adenine-specific DNA-methyltransferase